MGIPTNAKLKLIQGEGPLHLVGSHCVDFYGYKGDENAEDSDEDSEEEEAVENKEEAKKELESLKEVGISGDVTDKKTPTKDAEKEGVLRRIVAARREKPLPTHLRAEIRKKSPLSKKCKNVSKRPRIIEISSLHFKNEQFMTFL